MENKKLRIRSKKELDNQNRGLAELCNILETLNINYMLGGGTLLGFIRDGDFIPWDWDVHINLKTEEVFERARQLLEIFDQAGFDIKKYNLKKKKFKIDLIKYETHYELLGWYRKGKMRYRGRRKKFRLPDKYFLNPEILKFRDKLYTCMSPPEEYLKYKYGNWKKPCRTDNKKEYLSSNFRRKPPFDRVARDFLKSIIKQIWGKIKNFTNT